jgi:hypothetical protein
LSIADCQLDADYFSNRQLEIGNWQSRGLRMARRFTSANSQRLIATGLRFQQGPAFTLSIWGKRVTAADAWVFKYYASATPTHHHIIGFRLTQAYRARVRGASTVTVEVSGTLDDGNWHHLGGVYRTTTSRWAYADGIASAENTTSPGTVATGNSVCIGAEHDGTVAFNGELAEAAIWSEPLSATEMMLLAKGWSPLLIQPDKLRFYAPLWSEDEFDVVSGANLVPSGTGSLSTTAHPRIIYPPGFNIRSVGRSILKPTEVSEHRRRFSFGRAPGAAPARRIKIDDTFLRVSA